MENAFKADQVGSYLRPAEVKEARAAFYQGHMERDALRQVEDKAISAIF